MGPEQPVAKAARHNLRRIEKQQTLESLATRCGGDVTQSETNVPLRAVTGVRQIRLSGLIQPQARDFEGELVGVTLEEPVHGKRKLVQQVVGCRCIVIDKRVAKSRFKLLGNARREVVEEVASLNIAYPANVWLPGSYCR